MHHGNIIITHNHFFRLGKTGTSNFYESSGPIYIEDKISDGDDNDERVVLFNYNLIEDSANVKNGNFYIKKIYDINFDHNVIKNCRNDDYSCSLELQYSKKYLHEFQIYNLSLIGCKSCCQTGGGLGIWIVFGKINNDKQGKFILKNCTFINNFSGMDSSFRDGGGSGGAFHCGNATNCKTEVLIDNCLFEGNSATNYGGAVCLQSTMKNEIINSIFINNSAPLGGGAVYLAKNEFNSRGELKLMDECVISNCVFKNNIEFSNNGHAIYFKRFDYNDENTPLIINDCNFSNNGGNEGYAIVLNVPQLILNNSIIEFTSENSSNSGLKIESITKIASIESCSFINNSGSSSSGIQININGQFNITKTIFEQTNSENSSIFYNPTSISTSESDNLNINGCIFQKCIGGCIYISTATGSTEGVNIQYNTFKECVNIDHYDISCINFGSNTDSISLIIGGNIFEHCNNQIKDSILISLQISNEPVPEAKEKQIEIINNIIDYDINFQQTCKLALLIEQPNRNILIHNCSFTNCYTYPYDSWANTISAEKLAKLTISECIFNRCGLIYSDIEASGNAIGIGSKGQFDTLALVQNCTFVKSSSAVSSYTESTSLIGNTIIECSMNTFRIAREAGEVGRGFELIENKFLNSTTGCVIFIWRISSSLLYCPTIRGNIFEHNRIKNDNMFIFGLGQMNTIVFENNTFRDIQTSKGGFAGRFESSQNSVNLTFINCLFEDHSQTTNGGAFCSSNEYNFGDIYLSFKGCHFKNNKANGNGGSLFISSNKDVVIEQCVFQSNQAESRGGAIYIEKVGGQLTIKDCEFKSNSATEGNAIYGVNSIGEFNLQGSNFNTNVNDQIESIQYMIVLEIGSLEISNIEFKCEGGDKIAYPILFKSTDAIQDIYFDQVTSNYSGILVIPSDLSEITFDNLTFYNCKCVEYIIEVSNSKINIKNTNITFSNTENACGGIRIHTKGVINIENSFFFSTKSSTGAICYSPTSIDTTGTTSDNTMTINKCKFDKNAGGGLYLDTPSGFTESIIIQGNLFNECTFHEKEFTTIGSSLTTDSIQLNINNNIFKNSIGNNYGYNDYIYSIFFKSDSSNPVSSDVLIFERNTIEFDAYRSTVFINIAMNKREFVIDNCSFSRCSTVSNSYPWCNTIQASFFSKLTISECVFFECGNKEGETNGGGNVIGISSEGEEDMECIIRRCIFNFTSAAVSSYIERITIKENIFYKCGKNTFRISGDKSSRGFEFTDNIISDSNRGVIINSWKNPLKYEPVIRNNTFEHILAPFAENIDSERDEVMYGFRFYISESISIVFENNTFRDITTSQGGFGGCFNKEDPSLNTNLQVTFTNCYFENNKQTTDESRSGNGGAIYMTNDYNSGDISISFNECHFNANSAEGNGGALSLLTNKDIVIESCVFQSNKAVGGQGGAIYIEKIGGKLTINNCQFNSNLAIEGNAIYVIDSIEEFILHGSNFNTNVNDQIESIQYMIVLEIGSLEISTIEFTCEGDKIAYPILFKSSNTIENLIFNNVTSKYSALLHIIEDENNQEIKFNNLTFTDCKCSPYIIDSYISSISIEQCNITFSNTENACGAIRINKYGTNEILNSEFSNSNSISGTICYSPQTQSPNDKTFTIESCHFKSCLGESILISTSTGSLEEVNIKYNIFEECSNIRNANFYDNAISGINFGTNTDSISLLIEGNTFDRCNDVNTNSILISLNVYSSPVEVANKLIEFINNTIYYEYNNDQQNPKSKLALRLYQPDREILIHHCTFTNCYKLPDEKPWANSISANKLSKLTITECHFCKCGYGFYDLYGKFTTNGGGNVIGIDEDFATETKVTNCIFDSTSTPISSYVECVTVINNTFNKCGRNTFRIASEKRIEGKGFELINNRFINSTSGCAIHIWMSSGTNSAISTCPIIRGNTFEHNRIENVIEEESKYMFLIKLGQMNTIVFDNNTFRDIQTSKGGFAGYFYSSTDTVNLTFVNCFFEDHSQTTNGGSFCSSNEYNEGNIYLTFEDCHFSNNEVDGSGGALFIDTNLDVCVSQCTFISNKASKASSDDGSGSAIYISKAQKVTIEKCEFLGNSGGVLISELVNSSLIEECNFFDNYGSNSYDFVITISNHDTKILNNIINFTNNTNLIGGIRVTKHGEIEITNNKIIRTKGRGAFDSTDLNNDGYTDKCLIFNYNLIEEVGNSKMAVFSIIKVYNFNIDHNIIKNCKVDNYLSDLELNFNQYYSGSFTWTNLTLIGCSSNAAFGGGLGIWIVFENKNGSLTFQDCHFENNLAKHPNGGGAFQSGCATIGNMALYVNNCQFINNSANLGGALSIQSGHEAVIYNCIFINNIAHNGGGAIYIRPSSKLTDFLVPDTTITKCRFESNQDSSNEGHAVCFKFDLNCQSIVEIKNDCYFINNGNTTSNGFTISSEAPELTISNMIIEFDSASSAAGLLIKSHTLNANIYNCKFINTASENGGAIQALNIECPISILDSSFECNAVETNTSAIYITTQNQSFNDTEINVKLCNFTSNLCSNGISLLYINNNCNFVLSDCFFHRNTVNQIIHVNPITELARTTIYNCYFDSQVMKSETYAIQIITGTVLVDSCSFIYDSLNNNGGIYLGNYCFSTYNCQFINTTTTSAITFKQTIENSNLNTVINCTFNKCHYQNTACFDIAVFSLIQMKNITIENIFQQNVESYFGQIKSSSNSLYLNVVILEEISFINNVCDNLYGGGSGLMILSEKVVFKQCRFINNAAIKSNTKQRPQPDGIEDAYYNGDGGGIQWGYSQLTYNTELEFFECNFIENKANRHGGAIAVQTLKTVIIIDCVFESNIADYKEETSESEILSFENHYHKKKEGRGGAIYINPTFSYLIDGQIYPSNNEHLTSILIENCTFLNNQAFDGFAIYIEGDEPENNFQISIVKNIFTNNKQINGNDDINKSYRCIIASEVTLSYSEIKDQNTFNSEIIQKISLVDHFGNVIKIYPIGVPSDESISLSFSDEIQYSETESMISETQSVSLTVSPSEEIENTPTESMTNETESISETMSPSEEIENTPTESMVNETESISEKISSSEEIDISLTESISETISSSEEIENSLSKPMTTETKSISETISSSEEIENSLTESINIETQSPTEFTNSDLDGPFIGGNNKKKGLSMGAIIGIVCGIVIAVIAVVSILVFLFIQKRKNVLKKSFHADELSIKSETKSNKSLSQREDEDIDLDFWL